MNVRNEGRDKKVFNYAKQPAYIANRKGEAVCNRHMIEQ